MEIHTIFIPLLICTGIFGFTDGQVDLATDLRTTVYTFFAAAGLPPDYADATPEEYNNEIINHVRKTCNKSDQAGVLTMATKIQDTKECILSLHKSINDEYSRITTDRKNTTEDFSHTFCPRLPDLELCLNNFKKDNPCLGPAELEYFDAYRVSVMARKKLMCKNNGENYKKLSSEGYITCSKERHAEHNRCIEPSNEDMPRNSELSSSSKPQKLPWSFPDKEECAKLEKSQECNLNLLQRCGEQDITNAMKNMNNEILVGFRCRNSANSQSSPGSLIILLIVTALTALRF